MVWYRLKHDLTRDGWLTTRQCDSLSVIQWTHSQLPSAVKHRYLSNDSTRHQLHDVLANYWLGSISSDQQSRQIAINNGDRASNSLVYDADQPMTFDCELAPDKPRYLPIMLCTYKGRRKNCATV